jgi:hypothetical protein
MWVIYPMDIFHYFLYGMATAQVSNLLEALLFAFYALTVDEHLRKR